MITGHVSWSPDFKSDCHKNTPVFLTEANITIVVNGQPKGQPRPRAFSFRGSARMYDPGTAEGWKSCIAAAWHPLKAKHERIDGPVAVGLDFTFNRPKSHYLKSGLRPNAPRWMAGKPDFDNLAKAVCDCLTQIGVWRDDAQVVCSHITKRYSEEPGCVITIEKLT